jgi:hypothetical protein
VNRDGAMTKIRTLRFFFLRKGWIALHLIQYTQVTNRTLMKYGITTKRTQVLDMVSPAHLLGAKAMENR